MKQKQDRILNSPENEKDHPPQKTPKKKVKVPNVNWNRYADPYLFEAVYLNIPSEAYSILFILENSIRGFISRVLSENHGDNWWSDYISGIKSLSKIVTEVERRRHDESENWHHSKRGIHEIYYTDYANLLAIIRSCDVDFSEYFKKVPARNLPGKLEELTPTRNVVAHNNKINKTDLDRLKTHAHDWFSYMQSLYAN